MDSWIHKLVFERDHQTLIEFFSNPENREIVDDVDEFWRTPLQAAFDDPMPSREVIQALLDAGAFPDGHLFMEIEDPDLAWSFIRAGADPFDLTPKAWWGILNIQDSSAILRVTDSEFQAGRRPHFGQSNPEEALDPFKIAMIKCGWGGYGAARHFQAGDRINFELAPRLFPPRLFSRGEHDPIWCNHRMGRTTTFLPDGRIILIAGEHEDFSDPDFCIYNDVIVIEADKTVRLLTYPRDVFPPTDFHTDTLVGDEIYISGSIGYPEDRRPGVTPLYALNTTTLSIRQVQTTGEGPGWISHHFAHLQDGKIRVSAGKIWTDAKKMRENQEVFELDLETMVWRPSES